MTETSQWIGYNYIYQHFLSLTLVLAPTCQLSALEVVNTLILIWYPCILEGRLTLTLPHMGDFEQLHTKCPPPIFKYVLLTLNR